MYSRKLIEKDKEIIEQTLKRSEIYPLIQQYYESGEVMLAFSASGECIAGTAKNGYQIIYILKGEVQIFSFGYNGKRVLLDQVATGNFCGHISKLRGFNYEATLVAKTDCYYLEIPDPKFDLLMKNKDFALEFYRATSQRTYAMYQKMLALHLFSKEENAAYYLWKNRSGKMIYGSLDSLSEEMGISRRSLCYLFRDWKKENIIARCNAGYQIMDMERLEELSKNVRVYFVS